MSARTLPARGLPHIVDKEASMAPGENAFGIFRVYWFSADKHLTKNVRDRRKIKGEHHRLLALLYLE